MTNKEAIERWAKYIIQITDEEFEELRRRVKKFIYGN